MPKRVLKNHLNNVAKTRRQSMFFEDLPTLEDNIDDEEPIKSVEDFHQKTKKQIHYIRSNQNNEVERLLLHNSKLLIYHVDHCNFPSFNVGMWPQENCDTLASYPTCAFSSPRPIFVSDKQLDKIDICYKRPMNRFYFKSRMRMTRSTYQTAMKNNRNIRSCTKEGIYHKSVFEMAERMCLQPDPYFHSSYDFYFTGGNLCVLPQSKKIIHAGGENLQEIVVTELPDAYEETDSRFLNKIGSFQSSEDCEIFECQPLLTLHNSSRQNSFIARQRNLITFDYVNDNNEIKTITQFRTKSTPFISFAQSDRDTNNLIITTMKQHIRLYDLSGSAPALIKLFTISPDSRSISWNTVKPWRQNTFMYANQKQFFMMDIRTSPDQWLNDVTLTNNDLICDHISAILPSNFSNLFYVATNHKLHCMDIRLLKQSSFTDSLGAVCRWTHQMSYAPLMIDTLRLRQTEYIALSSPIAGDLHICQLSRERNDENIQLDSSLPASKHIYSSPCLPYQPPTLLEAYEHARFSGKCLRVEANLEERIKCCTTGLKFFESLEHSESGIGMLLTSNSNGDIFAHTLSKREDKETEERCNKQSDDMMLEYERNICSQTRQPLFYTEIKDMRGLRKVMLCKPLSLAKKVELDEMDAEDNDNEAAANDDPNKTRKLKPKRLHLGRWQKPLSTLHSYKDALVADLLSIWDIDVEEEKKVRLGNLRHKVKVDPATKVEDWLQQNVNTNPPMLTIPVTQISNVAEINTSNLVDNTFILSQTQNTVDFENVVHSTQILQDTINISRTLDTTVVQNNDENTITVVDQTVSKIVVDSVMDNRTYDLSETHLNEDTINTGINKANKKKTKKYIKGF